MELTRISDITPTATPSAGQHEDAATYRPRLPSVIFLVVTGIEQVLVGLEGEQQPGGVRAEQDDCDADGQRLQVGRKLHGARGLRRRRRRPAGIWLA